MGNRYDSHHSSFVYSLKVTGKRNLSELGGYQNPTLANESMISQETVWQEIWPVVEKLIEATLAENNEAVLPLLSTLR